MDLQYQERLLLNSPNKRREPTSTEIERKAKKQLYYNVDRLVPSSPKDVQMQYNLLPEPHLNKAISRDESSSKSIYNQVLQNELMGENFIGFDGVTSSPPSILYSPRQSHHSPDYSLSPLCKRSQQILSNPKKPPRKIPKAPFKVLEAPQIQDDFYLNLVDWSCQNLLAVGLEQSVYLWNASTSTVNRLCDMPGDAQVTSVSWMADGTHMAIGSSDGNVDIWDVPKQKKLRTYAGHRVRVGSLAWSHSPRWLLSSGSRDRTILNRDVRIADNYISKLVAHKQEVCGLKWGINPTSLLASGGNDNKLFLWEQRMQNQRDEIQQPHHQFSLHKAAVKAIAWSPHQRGLLASGGGTADQCIRFWNAVLNQEINHIDTGSQVCNLAWSTSVNELVSTHGYSQNQISIWQYPSMTQIATLTGHTMRVLYLSMSPDGQTIVTGAGDETLRFWSVFPKAKVSEESTPGFQSFPGIR